MKESFKMERDQALRRVEKKTDRRVNFVLTHSGYLPNVNKIEHYLKEDDVAPYITDLSRLSL